MDEPLSNLDAKLRVETRANIASLQARLGTTTIYVTHDQVEAMTMGHRVAVLKDARLQQVDTPRNLYDRPANVFVAGFIGSPAMNLREGRVSADGIQIGGVVVPLPRTAISAAGAAGLDALTVGLRPEAATVVEPGTAGALKLNVTLVEELGADAFIYGRLPDDALDARTWVIRCADRNLPRIGEDLNFTVDTEEAHLFNPGTGERLG